MSRGGSRKGAGRKPNKPRVMTVKELADAIREQFGFDMVMIDDFSRKHNTFTFYVKAILKDKNSNNLNLESSKSRKDSQVSH